MMQHHRPYVGARYRREAGFAAWALAALLALTLLPGCQKKPVQKPVAPPLPTFTGPAFLHGTVGSLAQLRGYHPVLVSNFSLVAGLQGTGGGVPAYLRQKMINDMSRQGLGSANLGTTNLSPQKVLMDPNFAVVRVEGIIPPGATKGASFDVLVSALPETQTTSLDGGVLWTTELAWLGANPENRYMRAMAKARGPLYLSPAEEDRETRIESLPRGVIIAGGVVTSDMRLDLLLNQPSWQRSSLIADRINERFPRTTGDADDTAVAKSDQLIRLHVPSYFRGRVDEFLGLVTHLYVQRAENFEPEQARRLGELLVQEPGLAPEVRQAWIALGKRAIPAIRHYYQQPQPEVSLTALEAGIKLDDARAVEHLAPLTRAPDAALRRRAAQLLRYQPDHLRAQHALEQLLDDEDVTVRLAAYEALADHNHPHILRRIFVKEQQVKFVLDLVPAQRPLIYVKQARVPRVVIFNPMLGFKTPGLAKLWDNRLMLRSEAVNKPATVFYQPRGKVEPQTIQIAPTVANLVLLLGHHSTMDESVSGLDLPFSSIVSALYRLTHDGQVAAELRLEESPLAQQIAQAREQPGDGARPETANQPAFLSIEPTAKISDNPPVGGEAVSQ